MTAPAAPPQLSPDGHWWWTGAEWVPADQRPVEPTPAPAPEPTGFLPPVQHAPQPTAWSQPATAPADGLAIASLVLSLLWMLGLGSIAAIVTGHLSRKRAKEQRLRPSGVATAGFVLGIVGAAFITIGLLAAIAIPVFLNQRVKADDAQLKTTLRSAAVAEEAYRVDNGQYTTSFSDLDTSTPAGVDAVVFSADASRYCLGARTHARVLYYDGASFTTSPC